VWAWARSRSVHLPFPACYDSFPNVRWSASDDQSRRRPQQTRTPALPLSTCFVR
jgi:hypothetical protein